MREIKFRAWQLGGLPNAGCDTFTLGELRAGKYSDEHYRDWGQYTGLKDKNGVEIYEGDIVKAKSDSYNQDNPDPFVFTADIRWCPECAGFHIMGFYHTAMSYFFDMEVIGNIYENPELLK